MPKIHYRDYRPGKEAQGMIVIAGRILDEYAEQGFKLSLRQLYYQFVARDYLPNTDTSYARLGDVISRAREAGMIDWDHLQDRGRQVRQNSHWDGPQGIIETCVNAYHIDLWRDQRVNVEVWVEKEALIDVVGKAAAPWDVPYFANKGYLSTSAIWDAGHNRFLKDEKDVVILHLGDHDPSGIQMTEDIQRRVELFSRSYDGKEQPEVEVRRIALNMDQIKEHNPPPNPAKQTDSRYQKYVERFGLEDSWELDALEPNTIVKLINDAIREIVDYPAWELQRREQEEHREQLQRAATRWDDILPHLYG